MAWKRLTLQFADGDWRLGCISQITRFLRIASQHSAAVAGCFLMLLDQALVRVPRSKDGAEKTCAAEGGWGQGCSLADHEGSAHRISAAVAELLLTSSDQTTLRVPRSKDGAKEAGISGGDWRHGCSLKDHEAPTQWTRQLVQNAFSCHQTRHRWGYRGVKMAPKMPGLQMASGDGVAVLESVRPPHLASWQHLQGASSHRQSRHRWGVPRSEDGAEGAVSQMTTCNHGCRKTFPPLLVSPKLTIHCHGATGLQSGRSLGSRASRIGNSCRSLSHIVIPDTAEGTEERG